MIKKGIYPVNNTQKLSTDKRAKTIFELFLNNKDGFTQTAAAKKLGITQSQISKFIKEHSAPFVYGQKSYIFIREDGKFKLLESDANTSGLCPYAKPIQIQKFNDKFEESTDKLSEINAFTGKIAKKFGDIIVVYTIQENRYKNVFEELKKLYGESIYHTCIHKSKMIIVLKKNHPWPENIINSLCDLYTAVIEQQALKQKHRSAANFIDIERRKTINKTHQQKD